MIQNIGHFIFYIFIDKIFLYTKKMLNLKLKIKIYWIDLVPIWILMLMLVILFYSK